MPSLKSNFGIALANLGPDIKHVDADQSDPMPRKLTIGFAYSLYHSEYMGFLLVADYLVPLYKYKVQESGAGDYGFGFESSQEEYGFGAEWNYVRRCSSASVTRAPSTARSRIRRLASASTSNAGSGGHHLRLRVGAAGRGSAQRDAPVAGRLSLLGGGTADRIPTNP